MEGFKYNLYAETVDKLKDGVEEGGLQFIGQKVMEEARIKPVYKLEEAEPTIFEQSRQKLNTEAGIIIANHPGYYDTFPILNALERKDVKIVVSEANYKSFASVGDEYIIKASNDPKEAVSFLKAIKDHIENGGVVLIYPTGGRDRVDKNSEDEQFVFEDGLSVILRKCLRPNDMVYSFYVEPEDIKPLVNESIPRTAGVVSAVNYNLPNINKLKETSEIRVNERYSKALEWQETIAGLEREDKNRALERHFIEGIN